MTSDNQTQQAVPFKAETRQLLNILIHSLYSEREVFLRELISNASDALTRMNFEMLTNRDVVDPDTQLGIWITLDPDKKILTIRDTGIGMTADEMAENLGTIAHSGARAFIQAVEANQPGLSDIIGQFGVGFYSAFMAADWIRVTSRSYKLDAQPAVWYSTGNDTYTLEVGEKIDRGTTIEIQLKEDAAEFSQEHTVRSIIKKHSDFIPFPIFLGDSLEQVNQQTAIWRKQPREVTTEEAHEFYKQLSLDFNPPITYTQLNVDAPVQLYALLFIPSSPEKPVFSMRKDDGLKLYARKILIQEFCKDLLPDYLRFVQGVVDSEDLPLNVSRETIQASRIMPQLRRLVTSKVLDTFKDMSNNKPEEYAKFWKAFGRFIKEGIATDRENTQNLAPLLRYPTLNHPDQSTSLDEYIQQVKPTQKKIYYILGDDERSIVRSPHLDLFRYQGVDVILMTDPIDSFVLISLTQYKDFELVNVAAEKPDVEMDASQEKTEQPEPASPEELSSLIERFKTKLGEKVADVRVTDRLLDSPARLVDKEGSLNQEVQRVYRILKQDYEVPQKVLELNPSHPLLKKIGLLESSDPRTELMIDQIYENALLIEGLHPDPASMIERIQSIMNEALK